MGKKVLLVAEDAYLDPLGLFYLSSVAKQEGWTPKIILSKGPEYSEIERTLKEFQPDALGFTLYTGNHVPAGKYLRKIKERDRKLVTIVGGPHPTYFPQDSAEYADYVVVGEGLNSFRRILRGEVENGIVTLLKTEPFPVADREAFYAENPSHNEKPMKTVIASVGCPYKCTHCYNSNNIEEVEGFTEEQVKEMEHALSSKKFFPLSQRTVDEVIEEVKSLREISPATEMLFFEDDVFGINLDWLKEFVGKYQQMLPFHANMRQEFIDPKKSVGIERLELLKEAGCTGLSLAIESGNETVRREILNRNTPEELIFRAMEHLAKFGFKARTYQMLGLPYGLTTHPTKMNLDADLETLELNVRLRQQTGLPTFSWASILTPYPGTKIAKYCSQYGFYNGNLEDLVGDETYRTGSVLRHLKRWVGPSAPIEEQDRLSPEEQERYKKQLILLMNYFPLFARIEEGHALARDFLSQEDFSSAGLNKAVRQHIYSNSLFSVEGFNLK